MLKPKVTKGATKFWDEIEVFKKTHKPDILSIKALHNGNATPEQQKRSLVFITKYLCRANEINFYDNDRDTSFALGREAVGKILLGIALDSEWINGDKL